MYNRSSHVEENTDSNVLDTSSISNEAVEYVRKAKENLNNALLANGYVRKHKDLNDFLEKEYHLSNIEDMDFPDFRDKEEFVVYGVRGNVQKSKGNIMTYKNGEDIVKQAINISLP